MRKKTEEGFRSTAELASHMGLSRWTVSRVLNGHRGVGRKTQERVAAAVARFHFSPSPMGRGLSGGRTGSIGICVQELEDLNLVPKISSLHHRLRRRGLHGLLEFSGGEAGVEEEVLRRFASMRVEGVIAFASVLPRAAASRRLLERQGIPFVSVDPFVAGSGEGVSVDRASAIRQVTGHLLELGHRRFASFGIDPAYPYGRLRQKALRRVLRKEGASLTEFFEAAAPRMDFGYGWRLAERLLAAPGKAAPTAIIALNDRLAFGAIEFLKRHGRRVPEDISVVGYDNSDLSAFSSPVLTTVDARIDLLIDQALERLLARIGNPPPRQEGSDLRIRPRLVIRASTGVAPDR